MNSITDTSEPRPDLQESRGAEETAMEEGPGTRARRQCWTSAFEIALALFKAYPHLELTQTINKRGAYHPTRDYIVSITKLNGRPVNFEPLEDGPPEKRYAIVGVPLEVEADYFIGLHHITKGVRIMKGGTPTTCIVLTTTRPPPEKNTDRLRISLDCKTVCSRPPTVLPVLQMGACSKKLPIRTEVLSLWQRPQENNPLSLETSGASMLELQTETRHSLEDVPQGWNR
ncbi:hypothetical protein LSH36_193g11023 [Paralvinella palmiformis]|uniref:Uncharacterized protein n=1 Tax=Paralvinella palmiformis TaxID=53620 RepID=A0AAD9JQJ5_9ANNE|nr:hypothetical protein LSH36_193g11023 [Paralvinella palmiformis]